MKTLQSKAPQINGWLVYMGATDRSLVLLQPDLDDIPSKDDWVLLNSMWQTNEYEYDSHLEQLNSIAKQIETEEEHIRIEFCIPIWIWLFPLCLLCIVVFLQIANCLSGFCLNDSHQNDLGLINSNHLTGGVPINVTKINEKNYMLTNKEFDVGTDFYFYPSPAIPPPKYNEIDEALLLDSSDDEHETDNDSNMNQKQKQHDAHTITAKKDIGNDKTNNIVNI